VPVLRAAEWYYHDGRYQWAIDHKAKLRNLDTLSELAAVGPTQERWT